MNQIDCKQAQNVWSRVMAAQANAQSTSANPPVQVKAAQEEQTASITPEQLLSSIEYEMLDAVTYQCLAVALAGRTPPRKGALGDVFSSDRQKGLPQEARLPLHHLQRRDFTTAVSGRACRARPL